MKNFLIRKLTAEEIEERRLEMMDNAKWRDEQRSKNVQRYREESAKEIEEHSKSNGAKFIVYVVILYHTYVAYALLNK